MYCKDNVNNAFQKNADLRGEAVDKSTSSVWAAPPTQELCAYK